MSAERPADPLATVRELYPPVHAAIEALEGVGCDQLDAHVREIAAARVAELLVGERRNDTDRDRLPGLDRAVLELADQFVSDVVRTTDEQVRSLGRWLSVREVFELVNVLYVFDATQRLRIVLGRVFAGAP